MVAYATLSATIATIYATTNANLKKFIENYIKLHNKLQSVATKRKMSVPAGSKSKPTSIITRINQHQPNLKNTKEKCGEQSRCGV